MKNIKIKYNPYLLKTDISVDGIEIAANSSLQFGKQRLQEWSEKFVDIFLEEYRDANATIEFTGSIADYNDIREAIDARKELEVTNWRHNPTPEVEEVEEQVYQIFNEIQNGQVEALKDKRIIQAFESATCAEFAINVVATMSAGKSTLINALLGKELMPSGNQATTATIVRIIATEQKNFLAVAYDKKGKECARDNDITCDTMKMWNKDDQISAIDIYGPIPCVDNVGMRLVLVDTPGPNNAHDERHKAMTYGMLESSEKSLVLFVVNATALGVTDEAGVMEYVSDCMKKGGKQSRDRYIFAVNKLDTYSPTNDSIIDSLNANKENLESIGIINPNLFPTASLPCLQLRASEEFDYELEMFKRRLQRSDAFKFDKYYDYNHLPQSSRARLESQDNGFTDVELHTGIPSIEEAIRLYVSKYARTMKVKDLVDSFNQRLVEERTIVDFEKRLRNNREAIGQMANQISNIRQQIRAGEMANEYAALIDGIDVSATVRAEVYSLTRGFKSQIDSITHRYTNDTNVLRSDAERIVNNLRSQYKNLAAQIDSKVSSILANSFKLTYDSIISRYRQKLSEFGYQTADGVFDLKPVYFVESNINRLDRLFRNSIKTIDEGKYEPEYGVIGTHKEKLTNWIWEPENWFTERYETVKDYGWKDVWKSNMVERVNMSKVVSEYFSDLYADLTSAPERILESLQDETDRLKAELKAQIHEVSGKLADKLNELQHRIDNQHRTEEEIRKQEADLQWMNGIIERVNNLINY